MAKPDPDKFKELPPQVSLEDVRTSKDAVSHPEPPGPFEQQMSDMEHVG
jgi:hypothetical protein